MPPRSRGGRPVRPYGESGSETSSGFFREVIEPGVGDRVGPSPGGQNDGRTGRQGADTAEGEPARQPGERGRLLARDREEEAVVLAAVEGGGDRVHLQAGRELRDGRVGGESVPIDDGADARGPA